jgi:hypothetical protein
MIKGIDNIQANAYSAYTRINNNPKEDIALKKQLEQEKPQQQEAPSAGSIDLRLEDIRPRQNASLEDISLSLNEPKGFEMKGRDSDLAALDMEKAVSDMQKDQALMQYQYFVGDTNLVNNEDGIVIAK